MKVLAKGNLSAIFAGGIFRSLDVDEVSPQSQRKETFDFRSDNLQKIQSSLKNKVIPERKYKSKIRIYESDITAVK